MSDEQSWQAPGSSTPPPASGGDPRQNPEADRNAPPAWGAPQQWSEPPRGWTPPPQPGLIPLRPLSFGALLGTPFQVLRRNPKSTVGISLLLQAVTVVLGTAATVAVVAAAFSRLSFADDADFETVLSGSIGIILLSSIVPIILSIIATGVLQGVIVVEVATGTIGEKLTIGALLRRVRGRFLVLIGWALLTTLAVTLGIGLLIGIIVVLVAAGGGGGLIAGILIGVFGAAGAVVLYAWLATKLSLVPSALVLERLTLRRAIARSWRITAGSFWRTFGAQVLVMLMISIATQVVTTPISLLSSFSGGLLAPTDPDSLPAVAIVSTVLLLLVTIVLSAVGSVVQSSTSALVYLDLRMRREGLDLVLLRHVDDAAAGLPVGDPYRSPEWAAGSARPGAAQSDSPTGGPTA